MLVHAIAHAQYSTQGQPAELYKGPRVLLAQEPEIWSRGCFAAQCRLCSTWKSEPNFNTQCKLFSFCTRYKL